MADRAPSNKEFSEATMLAKIVRENPIGRLSWSEDDEGMTTVTLSVPDPVELGPKEYVQRQSDLRAALAAIGAEPGLGYWLSDEQLIESIRQHSGDDAAKRHADLYASESEARGA